jgi:fluoride exporter
MAQMSVGESSCDWHDPSGFCGKSYRQRLAYSRSGGVARRIGETLPLGKLVVNLVGSLLIGFAAHWARSDRHHAFAQIVRVFVMVGICGGLTTFSSFTLQTFHLLREKRFWIALANILFSAILCIAMVAAGWWLATLVLG